MSSGRGIGSSSHSERITLDRISGGSMRRMERKGNRSVFWSSCTLTWEVSVWVTELGLTTGAAGGATVRAGRFRLELSAFRLFHRRFSRKANISISIAYTRLIKPFCKHKQSRISRTAISTFYTAVARSCFLDGHTFCCQNRKLKSHQEPGNGNSRAAWHVIRRF